MPSCRVVAVGGHESDGGRALREVLGPRVPSVAGGRELTRHVRRLRARGETVCVVPMTLGRDPELVADAARTLLALSPEERAGTVLAEPFGTAEHLVGWLRAVASRLPVDRALLVTAPSGDPFVDADLYRIARLVRQYGRHRTVEVALTGGDPDPAEGVRRCRALGGERVVLLPASWVTPQVPDPDHAEVHGALLPPSAVTGVLEARVREAWRRRAEHGDDGLATGLVAAHDHGHSHSHAPGDDSHGHSHAPPHGHAHSPVHPHQHPHPHPRPAQPREALGHLAHGDADPVPHHGPHVSPLSRSTP